MRDAESADNGDAPAEDSCRDRRSERVPRAAQCAVVDDVHAVKELIDAGEDKHRRAQFHDVRIDSEKADKLSPSEDEERAADDHVDGGDGEAQMRPLQGDVGPAAADVASNERGGC